MDSELRLTIDFYSFHVTYIQMLLVSHFKMDQRSPPRDLDLSVAEDFEHRILSWLPFEAFARMRIVCKRWDAILRSRSFLHRFKSVPTRAHP